MSNNAQLDRNLWRIHSPFQNCVPTCAAHTDSAMSAYKRERWSKMCMTAWFLNQTKRIQHPIWNIWKSPRSHQTGKHRKTTSTITSYKPSMLKFHPFQTYPLQTSRGMMQSWNLFSIQQGIRHPFKKYPPTPEYLAPMTNPTPFGQMLRTIIIILSFKYSTHIIYNFKDLYIYIYMYTKNIYIYTYIHQLALPRFCPSEINRRSSVVFPSFFSCDSRNLKLKIHQGDPGASHGERCGWRWWTFGNDRTCQKDNEVGYLIYPLVIYCSWCRCILYTGIYWYILIYIYILLYAGVYIYIYLLLHADIY